MIRYIRGIRFEVCTIMGQIYILPFIKYTHDRMLNGDKEANHWMAQV